MVFLSIRHIISELVRATNMKLKTTYSHLIHPAVVRLAVHVPGGQLVYFQDGEALQTAQAGEPRSQLMAFFDANTDSHPNHVISRGTLYQDFPEMFTWDKKKNVESKAWGTRGIRWNHWSHVQCASERRRALLLAHTSHSRV